MTKQRSIGSYVEMMSGDENELYNSYSWIVVIVLINMLYGVGLPLLFPLTLFAWISSYVFNRLATVYYFKKTPMMDNSNNKNAIMIMKWAVNFYTLSGYWFLTNR